MTPLPPHPSVRVDPTRVPASGPAAVLWDMDGTLVDTEPYWMRAEGELVTSFGGVWTHDDAMLLVGAGLWDSALILQAHGVALDADVIVQRLTDRVQEQLRDQGVPWRPGARELLRQVTEAGIPTALVTMSVQRMARQIAQCIDFPAFAHIVSGDTVAQPKPDPEAYLTAARLLGVAPDQCIAIEDSPPGLAAALAAGTISIAVPHQIALPESTTYTRWPTLEGRSLADLQDLYAARFAAFERPTPA